jgi:pimeloyl-ACP methyl ester carboxylesterase
MPKAKVNGIDLYYEVHGQGEPLFMIMGFAGSRAGWIFQRRVFHKYFQVITFDNRGVGKSDKPDGPYSIRMMAEDTIGLMDHLGIEKAHILGVSMGGYIAQELAINYPERVRKLVLGCTYAREDDTGGHSPEYHRGMGLAEGCPADELRKVPIAKVLHVEFPLAFNSRLYKISAFPFIGIYARLMATQGVAAQFQAIVGHDTLERLQMIQAPTLVITGTRDRIIKHGSSDVLAKMIPNARLVKIEGGTHAVFVGMRKRFNKEVLDFLRER